MKKVFLLSCICIAACFAPAVAQTVYLADTAFTTDAGYGGAPASCVFTGGMTDGWEMDGLVDDWLSDEFTVPADTTWLFDTVILFGVQLGSGDSSTYLICNLEIYNGIPGLGGEVIWGDSVTNVLSQTGFTGTYRVDTIASDGGITGTLRPIMYLTSHLDPAPQLSAGTYWLAWSAVGSLSDTGTTGCPPKVLPGRINPPGQMGRQYHRGAWDYVTDHGQQEGFNMMIKAKAGIESVPRITAPAVALSQNVPNPSIESTNISFSMPQAGYARLSVYNAVGQLVATLCDGVTAAGRHETVFTTAGLPAGIYYYRLSTGAGTLCRQMLIMK